MSGPGEHGTEPVTPQDVQDRIRPFVPDFDNLPPAVLSELYEDVGEFRRKWERVLPEITLALLSGYQRLADQKSGAAAKREEIQALHAGEDRLALREGEDGDE